MVVVYGGVLGKGGKVLLSICLLWWGMVLLFFFGMISGLEMFLLKFSILNYLCSTNKEAFISDVLSPPVVGNDKVWNLKIL